MKKNKSLSFIAAFVFTVILSCMTAFAESRCPDCRSVLNSGATAHSASHSILGYRNLDSTYHCPICWTCSNNGHSQSCPQVVRVAEKTPHNLKEVKISSTQVQMQCEDCAYEGPVTSTCKHPDLRYEYTGPKKHRVRCFDCNTIIKEEACSYGKAIISETNTAICHEYVCSKCGDHSNEDHTFNTSYIQYTRGANYLANGMGSGSKHEKKEVCTVCGYRKQSNIGYGEEHTFSNNVCTKCGFKKVILAKPKSGKGKQTKVKIKKGVRAAYTEWDSTWRKWRHYPALKYTDHTYTVKLSWKKVKNAKGYFVSEAKNRAGQANVGGYTPNDTTKTSISMQTTVRNKKLSKIVYYVYPVSADGIYGKPAKITTKLHG